MPTNFFFNNFQNSQEQVLIEDLIIESIRIYGIDVKYLPRTAGAYDKLFNEDPAPEFTRTVEMEMYIKNVDGFAGDGDFLSKFGLEIRDQITFCVARRAFNDEIGVSVEEIDRPQEGDLIYLPLNKKMFEIRFVEHEAIFYQLGSLQMYELKCELFEFSNQYFKTGVDEIDRLYKKFRTADNCYILTELSEPILAESGGPLLLEQCDPTETNMDVSVTNSQSNDTFETEADAIIDFSEHDPFSEGESY